MKTKLILLTLVSIAVIWGCGKKKAAEEKQSNPDSLAKAAPAEPSRMQVISLPGLGMQSLLRNPKDSTKQIWQENMNELRGMNKVLQGSGATSGHFEMLSQLCCPCANNMGCCVCSKDSLLTFVAPKTITQIDLIRESKPTATTPLSVKEIDSLKVFTLNRKIESGKYLLKMKGDFKGKEMDFRIEIRENEVELVPRK